MHAMNLNSVSAVAEHVNNCVEAGFLKKIPNAARSLKVIPIKDYKETKGLFRQKILELKTNSILGRTKKGILRSCPKKNAVASKTT